MQNLRAMGCQLSKDFSERFLKLSYEGLVAKKLRYIWRMFDLVRQNEWHLRLSTCKLAFSGV